MSQHCTDSCSKGSEGAEFASATAESAPFAQPSMTARPSRAAAQAAVRTLIAYIGDDPNREGLRETPKRVIGAFDEVYYGYRESALTVLDRTFGEAGGYEEFVLVKAIPFYSHCECHMMPFLGKAHVAYRPVNRVVGLSKLARLVDIYALRLQTQASLTSEIANAIHNILNPLGVAVMVEAQHTCASQYRIENRAPTVTTHFIGTFRNKTSEEARFMALVQTST